MTKFQFALRVCALLVSGAACAAPPAEEENTLGKSTASLEEVHGIDYEDIYILRSIRFSRVTPTAFCDPAKTGFVSRFEDDHDMASISVRAADGRVMNESVRVAGRAHSCQGSTEDPTVLNFWVELTVNDSISSGRGTCVRVRSNWPEAGLSPFRCFADFNIVPAGYVGGLLTTNTMSSRDPLGPETNPAGYLNLSVATTRLWKQH